ncbi:CarD family transcriptional regulator [Rheinheimera salexigens]|uniref:CarD family transcriptional regulator n=1 Tax=Rheinheimera salexigens TaxID=1628148 RepID=UPI0022853BF9|nr:CarD family transcriptional regulator [Rheinheimera salexigens]
MNQGDRIYHAGYGIGIVKMISKKSLAGESKAKFVKLYFARNGLTWQVPANNMPSTIRSIISAKEARKIISHLQNWKGKLSEQWKVRATANQAAIDKGDPYRYAEVVKGLTAMQEHTTLSATDRKHLSLGLEFLCEEMAEALGKTQERVNELITDAISPQPTVA